MATEESEERDDVLLNKRLSKVFSKSRVQDGTVDLRYATTNLEHWYSSRFSHPHVDTGYCGKGRQVGKRWKDRQNRAIHRNL